jgi:prepilin-type N-terminal cleavage/methylation domain-containing protein
MHRLRRPTGFTLIELLIVVVIVAILVAIAIPRFTTTKGKAYASSLKSDLKNLATQQELYFYTNHAYAGSAAAAAMSASSGVQLTITEASATGWSATTTHPSAAPLVCAVFYGTAAAVPPATAAGAINCQ